MDKRVQKGQVLKQAREAKGISLVAVHEATKIPLDALKAIEEGYTIRTLASFYYRGFLKMYAQYLGVKVSDVIDDYQPEKLPEHIIDNKKEVIKEKIAPVFTPKLKVLIIKILAVLIVFLLLVKIVNAFMHRKPHRVEKSTAQDLRSFGKAKSAKAKAAFNTEKKKSNEDNLPLKVTPTAAASKNSSLEQDNARHIELAVRAKKDSWLQVKVDGEVVFRSTLRKGTVEIWRASDNIEISGKDIVDLELELNGKILGPMAKENRKAKKILIDHNGFSVKQ